MEERHERKQPDQKTGGFYCKNRRCKPHAAAAQTPEGQQRAALVCKYSLPLTVLVSRGGQFRTETALQSPRRGLTLKLDCTFTTSQERKPRSQRSPFLKTDCSDLLHMWPATVTGSACKRAPRRSPFKGLKSQKLTFHPAGGWVTQQDDEVCPVKLPPMATSKLMITTPGRNLNTAEGTDQDTFISNGVIPSIYVHQIWLGRKWVVVHRCDLHVNC